MLGFGEAVAGSPFVANFEPDLEEEDERLRLEQEIAHVAYC
jgi:hypothetical protein